MCTSLLVEYANGENELIILTAADLPRDKRFNSVMLALEYHRQKLAMFTKFCNDKRIDVSNLDHASLNVIVISQLDRLFKGMDNCPEWNDILTMYCMEFAKNKLYYFILLL